MVSSNSRDRREKLTLEYQNISDPGVTSRRFEIVNFDKKTSYFITRSISRWQPKNVVIIPVVVELGCDEAVILIVWQMNELRLEVSFP